MTETPAVSIQGVSKKFRIYHERSVSLKQTILRRGRRSRYEEFQALRDVSFEVSRGQSVGIVGRNGSGKSTLLKCAAGIYRPDAGRIKVEGRLAALLELGAGFYPEYSGRENIYLNGALLGLSRRYIDDVFDDIVAFGELGRYIDNTVKTYSSGMFARLGFSIAVHMDPDILVIDEILSVGDESFQRRCSDRIAELQRQGTTMLVVSHSLDAVRRLCDTCVWLDQGAVRASGPVTEVVQEYLTDVSETLGLVVDMESEGRFKIIERDQQDVGISSVTVIGPRGSPSTELVTGESVEVRIGYYTGRPLRGLRFAVNFVREDGVEAFNTRSADDLTRDVAIPTRGVVSLRIPSLDLLAGSFRLGVSISNVSPHQDYPILANAFPVRITNPRRTGYEFGVVELDHHWDLPTAETSSVSAWK